MKKFFVIGLCMQVFVCIFQIPVFASGAWQIKTVDSANQVGSYSSLALNASSYPLISYRDQINQSLKFASWNGSAWQVETALDNANDIGRSSSLALDTLGNPHISHFDNTNKNLLYTYKDVNGWHTENVDNNIYDLGYYTSIALDKNEYPHICYIEKKYNGINFDKDLKYAFKDSSGWHIEIAYHLVGSSFSGNYFSLKLDYGGYPHISYFNDINNTLVYVHKNDHNWFNEVVDSAGLVGKYNALTVDNFAYPHISYYDMTNTKLKYAYLNANGWNFEVVDNTGDVGLYTSIVLNAAANPSISYYDSTNADLKCAQKDTCIWKIETVDSGGDVGQYSSLALDVYGFPHIGYFDQTNADLKYAYKIDSEPPKWINTNLAYSSLTPSSLMLRWANAEDNVGVVNYKVYCNGNLIGTVKDAAYNVAGLEPDTTYVFKLEAGDTVGNWSSDGPSLSVTTPSPPDKTSPYWVNGKLVTSDVSSDELELSWSGAADNIGVVSYKVYENKNLLGTVSGNTYEVTGLLPNTTCDFKVEAGDAAGNWSIDGPGLKVITPGFKGSHSRHSSNKLIQIEVVKTFTDLNNHWAKEDIKYLIEKKIILGMGNGHFTPDRKITRAELAAFVVRALKLESGLTKDKSKDIKETDWYAAVTSAILGKGIMKNYPDGNFRPNQGLTREKLAEIMFLTLKYSGYDTYISKKDINKYLSRLLDREKIAPAMRGKVALLLKVGLIKGNGGFFAPKNYCSRAEAAVMIKRLID